MDDWLNGNHWAIWLGLALVLGVVEAVTVDFVFLMLAGGALAGMVAGLFTDSVVIQVIAAGIVALALLGTVRPLLKRRLLDTIPDAGLGIETYAGRAGVVVEPVDDRDGRVRFDGEIWSARTEHTALPLAAGQEIVVERVDGATLIVRSAPGTQDER